MPLFGLNRRFLAPYWEVVYILTAKQTKALQALLTAPTQAQAAQLAGIGLTTLKRYLRDSEFQAAYKQAVSGLIADASDKAKLGLSPAVLCLREIVEDKSANAQVRISAARSLLEFGLRLVEVADIVKDLEEMEDNVL